MKHQELAALARTVPVVAPAGRWLALLTGLVLMTLLGLLALPARAAAEPDPPDRAGRLSEIDGKVWIYATDISEWIPAVRNRPVTTGDRLSTEADGRAEVHVGSTVLRVAPNTELEVLALDDERLQLQLHSGGVTARLRTREAANEFSLATEEGRFRAERSGSYRFDRVDDTSHATVLSGQAVYEGDGTALTLRQGQRVEFWDKRGVAQYAVAAPLRDNFDDWVAAREAREERSVSTRYVSPEMTGVEDLDRYGRWEQTTEYGPIWTPREVAPGWAPYRMGHWAWVSPWGWTWVDDAPWGFAPFHYGRWVWHRSNWCWTPGRYVARPVYAPALVAWMGGPKVSVSVSVGRAPTVGWFPLGPREIYVPGYRVSPRYVRNVNVTHVTNITNVTTIINSPGQYMAGARYANRALPHAVTVVPSSVIERRQPVAPAVRHVNDTLRRDMVRERPRADAPVTAPPRFAAGTRPAAAPRVPPPGFAPGVAAREGGVNHGATALPSQRQAEPRERRGRDNPSVNVPVAPRDPAPPVATTPPPSPAQPRWAGRRADDWRVDSRGDARGDALGDAREGEARGTRPPARGEEAPWVRAQPPAVQPAPQPRGFGSSERSIERRVPSPAPDRALAPPPGERKRHHEMPGPPRAAVQAPAPQQLPRVAPPPAPVVQPPVFRPQVVQPVREAPPRVPAVRQGGNGNDNNGNRPGPGERPQRGGERMERR